LAFRNAYYNQLATQLDYAYQLNLPGFISASQRPTEGSGTYYGRTGIRDIAEYPELDSFVIDVASTYAMAAASQINYGAVSDWL